MVKWKWHERILSHATYYEPAEFIIYLEADCTIIIGDKEDVKEASYEEYKNMTLKEYFCCYINNKKEIDRLGCATVRIENCVSGRFDKLWDLPAIKDLKIFIESEGF